MREDGASSPVPSQQAHRTPHARRKRAADADATLRISPKQYERLTLFLKALERHYFIESRRMDRVSYSEAIDILLDQPWPTELARDFEAAAASHRLRDKL